MPPQNFMELYKFLPQTNCKKCGKPTCMAFALDLLKGKVNLEDCAPLIEEEKYAENLEKLKDLLGGTGGEEKELHIDIDEEACDGCGICVTACPVNARYCPASTSGKAPDYPPDKHQLFQVVDAVCELLNLEHCRRLEAEGRERECHVCEDYCPREAIKIAYI